MTIEDWIRSQIDLRANISARLGQAQDGTSASLMTWSDKKSGTWFWDVKGESVRLIEFMGEEPNPARICGRCNKRYDQHDDDHACEFVAN